MPFIFASIHENLKVPSLAASAPGDCADCFEPVCLADSNPKVGDYCWIAGWGSVSAQAGKPFLTNKMRDAGVNIFSNQFCASKTEYDHQYFDSKMFCAGVVKTDPTKISNTCQETVLAY